MLTCTSRRLRLVSLLLSICALCLLLIFAPGGIVSAATSPAVVTSQTSGSNNWPMYGYNAQQTDYNVGETLLGASNVSHLAVAWSQLTDNQPTTPLVVKGTVYVASGNQLYALNMKTGTVIWQQTLTGAAPQLSPLYYKGVIYMAPLYGNLSAYKASTGKLLWTADTGGANGAGPGYANPIVVNGVIYVLGNNGTLFAINATTGKGLWSVNVAGTMYASIAAANGVIYLPAGNSLYAYSLQSHKRLWSVDFGTVVSSTPAVANGTVYVGTQDRIFHALNASNGKQLWSYALGDAIPEQNAVVANGNVYIEAGYVLALNANTGKKVWQAAAGLDVFPSPGIAGANGVIYAGAFNTDSPRKATVYAFNATTGAQLWSYSVNGASQSLIPTVAQGMLFIGFDFSLYAFHLPG